jgi:hypothetical protein
MENLSSAAAAHSTSDGGEEERWSRTRRQRGRGSMTDGGGRHDECEL